MRIIIFLLSLSLFPSLLSAEEDVPIEPVIEYLEMSPKFTVNLSERKKYLMVNVQLMLEGEESPEKYKKHSPAIRHELIMLLSGRKAKDLQTVEQREKLRNEALEKVRETLADMDKSEGLRDLFFTEFLVN